MRITKFNLMGLFLSTSSFLAFSNEERVKDDLAYEAAVSELKKIEEIAVNKPGTPSMPIIAEKEYEYLLESNKIFLKFVAYDCKNETYKEGAVGGSAADSTQCETKKVYARIIELAKRYEIELVYKTSE